MEGNYLTSGDLAMWDTARTGRRGYEGGCCDGYGYHRGRGMAATGIGLGAGLGGAALVAALVVGWGVNQASKARSRGAENTAAAQSKTMELIAATVSREATRQDGVNIDVQQTLRSHANAIGTGGSASSNALAMAEALSLLNNNNGTGLNSAVGGCNYLRVARVSGSRLCGCDTCGDGE